MRVAEAVLAVLRDEGVDRVFGNPGTTELPFVDALVADGALPYVLGTHEGPLVSMADGYARATRRPAFVSLHIASGTANGLIGMLNALRSRTPMVVMAGQQDSRHLIQEPMLSGDLVALAAPATVWAAEARRPEEVPALLRQAFRAAVTPPRGPAFLSVPMDLLEAELPGPVPRRSELASVHPGADVGPAAALLASARRPAIVAGDGVGRAGGAADLVRLAETLGAEVFHAPMNDCVDFPMSHAAYRGMLLPDNSRIRSALDAYDVVLLAGVRAFVPHHFADAAAVGPDTRLVQVDEEAALVGRTYPVDAGLVGDVPSLLADLADAVSGVVDDAARPTRAVPAPWRRPQPSSDTGLPLRPDVVADVVARCLPPDAVLVEEAITMGLALREQLRLDRPGSLHHTVGGGLGWGAGAAVGVALAEPGRPVVAALGDGCLLFGLQALWSAARLGVRVTFLVFANGEYRTLKQTLTRMRGHEAPFLGMDLDGPPVVWTALAEGFGVPAVRVTGVEHLGKLLDATAGREGPLLIEVPTRSYAADLA